MYRELEREGVIATAPGRGSFVRDQGAVDEARRAATDIATSAVDAAVREARSLGLGRTDVAAITDASIARWYTEEES